MYGIEPNSKIKSIAEIKREDNILPCCTESGMPPPYSYGTELTCSQKLCLDPVSTRRPYIEIQ